MVGWAIPFQIGVGDATAPGRTTFGPVQPQLGLVGVTQAVVRHGQKQPVRGRAAFELGRHGAVEA